MKVLSTFVYKSWCGYLLSLLLGKASVMEWLDRLVCVCYLFRILPNYFPKLLYHFTLPVAMCESFSGFTSLITYGRVSVSIWDVLMGMEWGFIAVFKLHVFYDQMLNIFRSVSLPSVVLWWNDSNNSNSNLLYFNLFLFSYCVWVCIFKFWLHNVSVTLLRYVTCKYLLPVYSLSLLLTVSFEDWNGLIFHFSNYGSCFWCCI